MNIPRCLISSFKQNDGILLVDKRFLSLFRKEKGKYEGYRKIIDFLGEESSSIQGLRMVITTFEKLLITGNRVYLYADLSTDKAVGLLKVGKKNLFIRDMLGAYLEVEPLCCLDFFVHASVRRKGIGKKLFEQMLKSENIDPSKIGYDRPSHMLRGFLKKHYQLTSYIPQSNNFVIFNDFFTENKMSKTFSPVEKNRMYQSTTQSPLSQRELAPKNDLIYGGNGDNNIKQYQSTYRSPMTQRELEPNTYKFARKLNFRKYY